MNHIDLINNMYNDQSDDPSGDMVIRYSMGHYKVSFEDLTFTKADLEAKMHQLRIQFINDLYTELDQSNTFNPLDEMYIHKCMKCYKVSFIDLDFTKADLEEKVQQLKGGS